MAGNLCQLKHSRSLRNSKKDFFFFNPQIGRSHENNGCQKQRKKRLKRLEENDSYLLTSHGLSSQQPV